MKGICLIIYLICISYVFCQSQEQNRFWVFLSDKKDTKFDPEGYFDKKAIERRLHNNLPVCDSSDYPLNKEYIAAIDRLTTNIGFQSRWFNAVAVLATDHQLGEIIKLPFVKDFIPIILQTLPAGIEYDTDLDEYSKTLLFMQTRRLGVEHFEANNIDGKGIRIAIFDAGFPSVDTSPVFDDIRREGRIIKTWDFSKNKENVYGYMSHGTMVMSCIGGVLNGQKIGLATGAEFLLARTEIMTEPFSEEENWLAAAEWADKNGAHIINSSLGYTFHRYFPEDMDGHTSLIVRAANKAASKGIIVVNAMGNDGVDKWTTVGTPADADSVLAIGGINPNTDIHTSFSSFGPTSDKRLKPNVCAYGHVIAAGKKGIVGTQGTSFSSPLVAGFVACALQAMPELSGMEMFHEIEKSGDLFPYFDYAHGYGVPQASYFTSGNENEQKPTFTLEAEKDILTVNLNEIPEFRENEYVYYHIQNPAGYLEKYAVVQAITKTPLEVSLLEFNGCTLRVHYKGYTAEYDL